MFRLLAVRSVRLHSTALKPMKEVLPPKKIISRLLFDINARYNYNKYFPIIESIYQAKEPQIPDEFSGNDLLLFQRVLAQIRKQTHTINPKLVQIEHDLLEIGADRGSRDALTTLSFLALEDSTGKFTPEDQKAAQSFIKQLIELKHPLVFKLAGDKELAGYQFNSITPTTYQTTVSPYLLPTEDLPINSVTNSPENLSHAINFYNQFLELDPLSILSGSAHRSLGLIYFKTQDLVQSLKHFEMANQMSPDSDNAQCNYFLGLLNEHDHVLSRYYFELAASEGFKESFANLGYLELNVFKNTFKAKEWFKLGSELGVNECIVGLFDCDFRSGDYESAFKVIARADKLGSGKLLRSVRSNNIKKVQEKILNDQEKAMKELVG